MAESQAETWRALGCGSHSSFREPTLRLPPFRLGRTEEADSKRPMTQLPSSHFTLRQKAQGPLGGSLKSQGPHSLATHHIAIHRWVF